MLDLIISGGEIYDGSGNPEPIRTDIGVNNGRIEGLDNLEDVEAAERIDASGLYVMPGFVDPHGHSCQAFLIDPKARSLTHQGITTQINGQCGSSPAPISPKNIEDSRKELEKSGIELNWSTIGGYREHLQKNRVAVNAGVLVGHGTVRAYVCGYDAVAPDESQMNEMVRLVEQAMDEGALGLSSGIQYAPGKYADTEEVIPLAAAAAKRNGIYTTHMRSEGAKLWESIEETLNVGRKAGIPVEIAHLKSSGRPNWGKIDKALETIEQAEREGLQIAFDRYPYLAGATSLSIYFQTWLLDGGRKKMLERLKDPKARPRIREQFDSSVQTALGWDKILITGLGSEECREVIGMNIQQVADCWAQEPVDAAIELLVKSNGYVGICSFSMDKTDTDKVLTHRLCSICTDASNRDPEGYLSRGMPHPRAYGTFPRFLSEYVRDRKLVAPGEAARRMCRLPAQHHGLRQRGELKKGYWADIVCFQLDDLEDRARYGDSHHFPKGIEWVIVNGEVVIRQGEHTGALPGIVL